MKRPIESDYTSLVAYTRALEEYCDALARVGQEPVGTVGTLFDENVILRRGLDRDILVYTTPPAAQRTWVGLIRGVRVEGDTVVITVKNGNDAARELCGALIEEMNT